MYIAIASASFSISSIHPISNLAAHLSHQTPTEMPTRRPTVSPTITAPTVSFYKPANVNWTNPQYYDVITSSVWLTRQTKGPVYNYR